MADLPTIANRVNDIEVAPNAPLTESLNRKYGSNLNYLLDLLDVTDGSTTPTGGSIGDLFSAVSLVSTHTMDLQTTLVSAGGLNLIGTFAMQPFVNQVIYARFNTAGSINMHLVGEAPFSGTPDNWDFRVNIDAGGTNSLIVAPPIKISSIPVYGIAKSSVNRQTAGNLGTRALNAGGYYSNTGVSTLTANDILEVVELDWRDGNSIQVFLNKTLSTGTYSFYRGYRLNLESLIF